MRHPLLVPDLREIIAECDEVALRDFFNDHHPVDTAELLDDLAPAEVLFVLKLLDGRTRAQVFSYLDQPLQEGVAEAMDRGELAALVTYMSHDERADFVSRLPDERMAELMQLLAQAEREDIRRLTSYERGVTGSVMTSDYATVAADETAAQAINRLRHEAPDRETIYYCYVVDDSRRLIGMVSLKDLILAPASRRVSQIMQTEVVSAHADEPAEQAAQKLAEYDLIALPVLDSEDRLIGIVTHDDVIDVIVEEATEDVHRLGGVGPLADTYLRTPFVTLWSKRAFWLSILFVGGFLTTTAMASFEGVFEALPALILFLPLIVSAGGNCGSQSSTLITRALALQELAPRDWLRVFWHEVRMGVSLGLSLGALGFLRALLIGTPPADKVQIPADEFERLVDEGLIAGDSVRDVAPISLLTLAWVVALGVAVVVLWGNLVGAMLPLALKRLGLDPALMSNPFVASLVDVTGIVCYFALADWLLI